MTRRGAVLLATLLLLFAVPLAAQSRSTAALRGVVTDERGVAIAGALVETLDERTGSRRQALANEEGQFLILQLQPGGPYTVSVRSLGYAERRVEGIRLSVGSTFPVTIRLTPEALEIEGVEVEVDPNEIFGPNEVGPATRIGEREIDAFPLLSRDITELAALSPLVRTTEGGGFSVAGQNDRYNAILIDGQFSKDLFGLTAGGLPGGQAGAKLIPVDAVAQYEILVAPYDVRLAGFTGGVMNAVTRSGTNDWWGRATAVNRNETLIGDLDLPSGTVDASTVDRALVAGAVGGPLVRDRVHLFAAAEFERRRRPPNGINLYRDAPLAARLAPGPVEEMQTVLESDFGIDPGEAGPVTLERTLANTFLRLDANLGTGSRLTARHIFAHAENEDEPNREVFGPYGLSSNGVDRQSTSHIGSLQFFRQLSGGISNELAVTVQRTVDRSDPRSDLPQIDVGLISMIEGAGFLRYARLGGQYFAQTNDLEQTSVRVTNSVDIALGDDVVTLGLSGSWLGIRQEYLPGSRGQWLFASLSDLEQNRPYRFMQTVLSEGQDDHVDFGVGEVGAFVQRQLNAGDGLTMHFGLRADLPFVRGRPGRNRPFEAYYGYNTSTLPSSNLLVSPRWGFNWRSEGERPVQVRAGAGLFSGQIPYVWLANAFHGTGLRSVVRRCEGRGGFSVQPSRWPTPPMDPTSPPDQCLVLATEPQPFDEIRNVVVFDPTFRYPQDLRLSITVDREVTDRATGTLGFLFNTAFNQVGMESLNVKQGFPEDEDVTTLGGTVRRYYATLNEAYDRILVVTNEGQNVAFAVSAELRGALSPTLGFRGGYSWSRSLDRTSLTHVDMESNFGTTPAVSDVNRPPLETSNFDRPHKIVASLFGTPIPGLPDTEVSILYTGQSGLPFTYVYAGDINGDGFPGAGGAFGHYNDPIHVPDVLGLAFAPISPVSRALFQNAMESDPCLDVERGTTLNRNSCRTPWEHQLDLRLAQGFEIGGAEVRLELDVLNLLDLAGFEAGRVQRNSPIVPLLGLCEVACEGQAGVFYARWTGAVTSRDANNRLVATRPWVPQTPESQWRMQIGARVTLGAGR